MFCPVHPRKRGEGVSRVDLICALACMRDSLKMICELQSQNATKPNRLTTPRFWGYTQPLRLLLTSFQIPYGKG